jgi:hypothetical protein
MDRANSSFLPDGWITESGIPTLKFAEQCAREWEQLERANTKQSKIEAATEIAYCLAQRRGRDF